MIAAIFAMFSVYRTRLLGVPVIEAPSEAEAQCARMAADGKLYLLLFVMLCIVVFVLGLVFATATEDADALTFGTPVLVRHLNFSDQQSKGKPILVFSLNVCAKHCLVMCHFHLYFQDILKDLQLSMEQFVDFCILCGCDYCDRLKGIQFIV